MPNPIPKEEWDIDEHCAQAADQLVKQAIERSNETQSGEQSEVSQQTLNPPVDPAIRPPISPVLPVSQPLHHGPPGNVPPDSTLYIFHVPNTWTENELQELFGTCGNIISSRVVRNPDGTSKGLAFVDYDNPASAKNAVLSLHNYQTPEGKFLLVKLKDKKDNSRPKPY